jgi:hypothetical protein
MRRGLRGAAAPACLIMGCLLFATPASADLTSSETLQLDAHEQPEGGDEAAGPVQTSDALTAGTKYTVTVGGTLSFWSPAEYEAPYFVCGTPESAAMTPSPDQPNGPVSHDAEVTFARAARRDASECDGLTMPRHQTQLELLMSVGGGFSHVEPIGGPHDSPTPNHTYEYELIGEGEPAAFRFRDTNTRDNYGVLTIKVEPADVTPPVITPHVNGLLGNNGWYTSDVAVTWTVEDPDSPILSSNGCDPSNVASDTAGVTFTCTATSDGGTASEDVTIKRDATKPAIVFSGNLGTYYVDENINISCSATDALSGIASATCPAVNQAAWQRPLGTNTLDASATDNAGNSKSASTSFVVKVSAGSLCRLTHKFKSSSAKYLALSASKRAAVDALYNAICKKIDEIAKCLTAKQKATLIAQYKLLVNALVPLGWLTNAQATVLKDLAGAL